MPISENINTAGGEFSGVERNLDVFVGGCRPNTSDNAFINHIGSKGIHVIQCEKMVSVFNWYIPFKKEVKASETNKLLNPDI